MSNRFRGQTTLIMIVLVLIVFGGLVFFLVSVAQHVSDVDYLNDFVHYGIISMARSDTGSLDTDCKLLGDTMACYYLNPGRVCSGLGMTCEEVARQSLNDYIGRFEQLKGFRYYLKVVPITFLVEPSRILSVGNSSLETERIERLSGSVDIFKRGHTFNVELLLARD